MIGDDELDRFAAEARHLVGRGSDIDLLLSRFFDVILQAKRLRAELAKARKPTTPIVVSDSLLTQEQYKDILEIHKAFSLADSEDGTSG